MGVSVEAVYFVVRAGPDHEYGKSFNCAFHVHKNGWDSVRIVGLPEIISMSDFKELRSILKNKYGFKKAVWERMKMGVLTLHEIDL